MTSPDPSTWEAGDGHGIGVMLGEELAAVIGRFIETRVVPAAEHARRHSGDHLDVLRGVAGGLRWAANQVDPDVPNDGGGQGA